jgi:hypothetical protein
VRELSPGDGSMLGVFVLQKHFSGEIEDHVTIIVCPRAQKVVLEEQREGGDD